MKKSIVVCIMLLLAGLSLSACDSQRIAMPSPTPTSIIPTPTLTPPQTPSPTPSPEQYHSPYLIPSDDGMVVLEFPAEVAQIMDNNFTPNYEETGEIKRKEDGAIRLEMTRENYDAFIAVFMDRLWMDYDMNIFRHSFIKTIDIKTLNFDVITLTIYLDHFTGDALTEFFWNIIPTTWIYQLYAQAEPEVIIQLVDAGTGRVLDEIPERLYDYFGLEEPNI